MRHRKHPATDARPSQRAWLKLVQNLLHLGVLLGGALGLPQAVASATATALQDTQTRGEVTLAREGARVALAAAAEKDGGPDSSSTAHPTPATAAALVDLEAAEYAKPGNFVPRLRSKHRALPFQARAPPRKSRTS
jgi:hypothetical protein